LGWLSPRRPELFGQLLARVLPQPGRRPIRVWGDLMDRQRPDLSLAVGNGTPG